MTIAVLTKAAVRANPSTRTSPRVKALRRRPASSGGNAQCATLTIMKAMSNSQRARVAER
jgi:hypothetical protein